MQVTGAPYQHPLPMRATSSGAPPSSRRRTDTPPASAGQSSLLKLNDDLMRHILNVTGHEKIKPVVTLSRSCKHLRALANQVKIEDAPKKIHDLVIKGGINNTLKTTLLALTEKYDGFSPPFQYERIKDLRALNVAI